VDRLLERGEELAALESAVDAARDGRGQLVLVAGEAGIGKTSLVRALRERLGARAAFLIGVCEPLSVPVPLAPLRELVAAEAPAAPGEDALAFARSVLGTLRARAPAVAVLEDAHWADPATVDVLRLLARRVEDAGAVVIVTYRDDELAVNAALALLVGDLVTNHEAALAALPGDERAARDAVAGLQRLGAAAAARAFARDRAPHGAAALRGPRRSTLANAAGLTRREQEVLQHVAAGATNADIARALHLSHRTVEHHVSAILAKLGATTRTGAVDAARTAGVLSGETS
jgi:DNA-binding NarL/FixJ family response regulator